MPKMLQDAAERPLVAYSAKQRPLASLTVAQRGLVMAELAMIAYNDQAEAQAAAAAIGFPDARLYNNDGSQAFRFRSQHDCIVAFRGTEPDEWNDWKADASATLAAFGAIGRVHSGFQREVEDLWPMLLQVMYGNSLPIWFCGHSLGGALATICAYRCEQSPTSRTPEELHTFGSPRVGCGRFAQCLAVNHYRWVHNNDIVTRVPPCWMGYRHGGIEKYLDRHGQIRTLRGLFRILDRIGGFVRGLFRWRVDLLADHSIHCYAEHLALAAKESRLRIDAAHSAPRPRMVGRR